MQNLQIAIGVLLVVAIIAFIYTHYSRGTRQEQDALTRPRVKSSGAVKVQPTAAQLLSLVSDLRVRNAQWPEILATLNPTGDQEAAAVLMAIRGPHMFDPRTGLGVLESGFRSVEPGASLIPSLQAAHKSMTTVVGFGR